MVSFPFLRLFRWRLGVFFVQFSWSSMCAVNKAVSCTCCTFVNVCIQIVACFPYYCVCVRKSYWGSVCRLNVYMCTLMQCSVGECVSHTAKSSSASQLDDHLGTGLSIWTVKEWSWSKRRGKNTEKRIVRGIWEGDWTSLSLSTSHISVRPSHLHPLPRLFPHPHPHCVFL